ncbi:BREX system P-loop protein BrxC [Idiomarina sp. ST20R2A10]|uniref:BREX system P-loop protein BrxC n=1 Tax=Idiomarina sp. ST20R2A10 TaxID=3418369 RepID=UPI003EC5A820
MLNRDIYQLDPQENRLENNGVADVKDDQTSQALKTLRYELQTFVCDGQYQKGLDKILSTYLRNLTDDHEQPGVWISGFFGSGKSHLAKMLRALWVNQTFEDGASARDVADLPEDLQAHFVELSNQAKRYGGLHAASGTLGSGADNNVRLALLNIIFKSAGLPEQYHQARFVMWLKKEGLYEQVKAAVEAEDDDWLDELDDLYMSRSIAGALLEADPTLADDIKQMRQLLKEQYPHVSDVTNTQMVNAIQESLSVDGKCPLTVIVLDEVQQYIGSDTEKSYSIQEVVETCCKASALRGRILFVGTGQSSLSGTPSLQKLMGRFQVQIQLSDTDVEAVIRKVILQKKEAAKPDIDNVLKSHLGEISRQLRGTRIEFHRDDEKVMVADYPLLPVRRRFWEKVLRIVDTTGTVSQLRNQLKVIHEAAQATADKPLGHVVPADFIYDQISVNLIQTGVISKEMGEIIGRLAAGDESSKLKSRILSLVLLIGKLPTEPAADSGVRATAEMLSDLLIDDLDQGKDSIRTAVPKLLEELVDDGHIMAMQTAAGTEYRVQTQESAQWYDTFRQEEVDLRGNMQRVDNLRMDMIHKKVRQELGQVRLTQGQTNEVRQLLPCFESELPRDADKKIYVWIQDGWSSTEKDVLTEARRMAPEKPTIFLFIPARNRSELSSAIIAAHAADATLQKRGIPGTEAGKDARSAMETRKRDADRNVETLLKEIFEGVMVLQAGGNEVDGNTITERVEKAGQASVVRLYRDFDSADHPGWAKVYERARKDGGQNALEAIGHKDDAEKHPVCAKIKNFIGVSKQGKEIREEFQNPPYGWSQDTVEGAIYAMISAGVLIAEPGLKASELERKQLPHTTFRPEKLTIRTVDMIKIRRVINAAGIKCESGEEKAKAALLAEKGRDLAESACGPAPFPAKPDTQIFDDIARQSGNAQLNVILENQSDITDTLLEWQETAEKITKRRTDWSQLNDLLDISKDLAFYAPAKELADTIIKNRSILDEPNPVSGIIKELVTKLREALRHRIDAYQAEYQRGLESLTNDEHWQQLSHEQQQQILDKRALHEVAAPDLSTTESLIDALDSVSLGQWSDRKESLASKFENARQEAVELLLPKVQRYSTPRVTVNTEAELDAWLEQVKKDVLAKLNDGPVTF